MRDALCTLKEYSHGEGYARPGWAAPQLDAGGGGTVRHRDAMPWALARQEGAPRLLVEGPHRGKVLGTSPERLRSVHGLIEGCFELALM